MQKEKGTAEGDIDNVIDSVGMGLNELWEKVENRRARHFVVWGLEESVTT